MIIAETSDLCEHNSPLKEKYKPPPPRVESRNDNLVTARRSEEIPSVIKVPGVCSDYKCKAKQQMQAEIVESLIKDRDQLSSELAKLKSDVKAEVTLLYR